VGFSKIDPKKKSDADKVDSRKPVSKNGNKLDRGNVGGTKGTRLGRYLHGRGRKGWWLPRDGFLARVEK